MLLCEVARYEAREGRMITARAAGLTILIFSSWLDGILGTSRGSVIMRLYWVLWKSRKCKAN